MRGRRGRDEDMAPVGGIVAANDEALLDEPVDVAAHRRQGDAETADEVRHLHLALVREQHQDLCLRHRDVDAQELGHVDLLDPLAELVEDAEHVLDAALWMIAARWPSPDTLP